MDTNIREFTETSNDAGFSVSYGKAGHSKEYANDRDAILAELGAKEARMSVLKSGVWRPYKIWGNLDAAKAFFAVSLPASVNSEIEKQQEEEEKARREYEEEVRRELDEERRILGKFDTATPADW